MIKLKQQTEPIQNGLEELVSPTPLGIYKLLSVWESLSIETQVRILDQHVKTYPIRYKTKILLTSIKSQNPYVRFLSARIGDSISEIEEIAKSDSHELLTARNFVNFGLRCTPCEFFELSDFERIFNISKLTFGGMAVAGLVEYYYNNKILLKNITEDHIFDILFEYLNTESFQKYFCSKMSVDGFDEFAKGKDIESLWALLTTVREDSAYLLINKLPDSSGFFSLKEEYFESLCEKYQMGILWNKNFQLNDLRLKIFKSPKYSERVKEAAVARNFRLPDSDFLEITHLQTDERIKIISAIAYAYDLDVCMRKAIIDLLKLQDKSDFEDIRLLKELTQKRLEDLPYVEQRNQLNEIRLYELAKQFAPWTGQKAEPLTSGYAEQFAYIYGFPSERFSNLSTWKFFIELKHAWECTSHREDLSRKLESQIGIEEDYRVLRKVPTEIHFRDIQKQLLDAKTDFESIKANFDLKTDIKKLEINLNNIKDSVASIPNQIGSLNRNMTDGYNHVINYIDLRSAKFWLTAILAGLAFFMGMLVYWLIAKLI